ncbi:hypothetical protein AArcCO_2879 [Halalkaliarchaeum sp. AArc-CO]|nr:hypothetical protein AArcCO_2879 [Halalkaliarchaeum sp. AArc-CO]
MKTRVSSTAEIGDQERVITEYAAEERIDGIVIGSHGRSDRDRHPGEPRFR